MGAAVLAASTEQTTHESQTEDNTENNSVDTDEASNTAETKTKECKIELSDNGILVNGETISGNSENSINHLWYYQHFFKYQQSNGI